MRIHQKSILMMKKSKFSFCINKKSILKKNQTNRIFKKQYKNQICYESKNVKKTQFQHVFATLKLFLMIRFARVLQECVTSTTLLFKRCMVDIFISHT
jgi:hypothetical protein